jgi:hypothetical protein
MFKAGRLLLSYYVLILDSSCWAQLDGIIRPHKSIQNIIKARSNHSRTDIYYINSSFRQEGFRTALQNGLHINVHK